MTCSSADHNVSSFLQGCAAQLMIRSPFLQSLMLIWLGWGSAHFVSLISFRIFLRLVYFVDFLILKEPLPPQFPHWKEGFNLEGSVIQHLNHRGRGRTRLVEKCPGSWKIQINILVVLNPWNSRNSYPSQNWKDSRL